MSKEVKLLEASVNELLDISKRHVLKGLKELPGGERENFMFSMVFSFLVTCMYRVLAGLPEDSREVVFIARVQRPLFEALNDLCSRLNIQVYFGVEPVDVTDADKAKVTMADVIDQVEAGKQKAGPISQHSPSNTTIAGLD